MRVVRLMQAQSKGAGAGAGAVAPLLSQGWGPSWARVTDAPAAPWRLSTVRSSHRQCVKAAAAGPMRMRDDAIDGISMIFRQLTASRVVVIMQKLPPPEA